MRMTTNVQHLEKTIYPAIRILLLQFKVYYWLYESSFGIVFHVSIIYSSVLRNMHHQSCKEKGRLKNLLKLTSQQWRQTLYDILYTSYTIFEPVGIRNTNNFSMNINKEFPIGK